MWRIFLFFNYLTIFFILFIYAYFLLYFFFNLTGSLGMYCGCQFSIFMRFLSVWSRETVSIMPSTWCFSFFLFALLKTYGLFIVLCYHILFYYYLLFYYYPIKIWKIERDLMGGEIRIWVEWMVEKPQSGYITWGKNIWFLNKEKNIKTPHYIPFTLKYLYIKIERHMYLATK